MYASLSFADHFVRANLANTLCFIDPNNAAKTPQIPLSNMFLYLTMDHHLLQDEIQDTSIFRRCGMCFDSRHNVVKPHFSPITPIKRRECTPYRENCYGTYETKNAPNSLYLGLASFLMFAILLTLYALNFNLKRRKALNSAPQQAIPFELYLE